MVGYIYACSRGAAVVYQDKAVILPEGKISTQKYIPLNVLFWLCLGGELISPTMHCFLNHSMLNDGHGLCYTVKLAEATLAC